MSPSLHKISEDEHSDILCRLTKPLKYFLTLSKKLIHMCDKKITFVRVSERQKLEIMISKLKNFRERSENNIFNDEDDRETYYSNDQYEADSEDSD